MSEVTRRTFLKDAVVAGAGIGAMTAMVGCSTDAVESTTEASTAESVATSGSTDTMATIVTEELPIPEWPAPETTSYDCDVLVVGGGWAGVAAARQAIDQGQSVVVVDKGRPGFSGYSPWSNSFTFFDEEYGDKREQFKKIWTIGTEYAANQNWFDTWLDESKTTYEKCSEWGVFDLYPNASDADINYYENEDLNSYHQDVITTEQDRHWKFRPAIVDYGAELVEYTMITDIVEDEGRVVGAVGFHCPSGTVINIACKAIIMATGAGSYKPSGYPTGSDTFDGDYIGYKHGLKIAGKEYNDFHGTSQIMPGSAYRGWAFAYTEPNYLTRANELDGSWVMIMTSNPLGAMNGVVPFVAVENEQGDAAGPGMQGDQTEVEGDPRTGCMTDFWNDGAGGGAGAPGMSVHKGEGVFISNDAVTATSLPGLYYAGDSLSSSAIGATYFGIGFSSCMSATQGRLAAQEANDYVASVEAGYIKDDVLQAQTEEILAPMDLPSGFDPSWVRDRLTTIMSAPGVLTGKTEEMLNAALVNVEYLRDNIAPKMLAQNPHELRLVHEMKSRILNAEMSLRSSLARKESRGLHYRADFPFRDDENFLCNITLEMDDSGNMVTDTVAYEEDWVGDTSEAYEDRYPLRFPGEADAMNIPEQESLPDILAAAATKIQEA